MCKAKSDRPRLKRCGRGVRGACFLLAALAGMPAAWASGLQISDVRLEPERMAADAVPAVEFEVAWDNAWRNAKNYDAVWIFIKLRAGESQWWRHARLADDSAAAVLRGQPNGPLAQIAVPEDRVGFFLQPGARHRGRATFRLRVRLDPGVLARLDEGAALEAAVYGLEMVYVPDGAFYLGDPDPEALEFAAFYRSGPEGRPDGPFQVSSEGAIEVGPQPGRLDYRAQPNPQYKGDRSGPIPEGFPKGVHAFYIMKYEITQGQYAAFLNGLPDQATFFRVGIAGRRYYDFRGSIRLGRGKYAADSPQRPHNFVSWEDGIAFADWAGLRPMTELEFTKAARGPSKPVFHEFPWGTSSKENLKRLVALDDDLVTSGAADEGLLDDSSRDVLGASYYWVLDLAGSLWERAVSVGHPLGRAYLGSHGDGRLSEYGSATNPDWPRGDDEQGGYGYRGGGYYEHGKPETEFNPHSPIAYRPFGAWAGGPRSLAYGFRCVRTAPPQPKP